MAEIHPFQGVHYNQSLVKDLANVICPPYDVITPQKQLQLYELSDRNFVRLEYGKVLPQDKDTDNKYTRASATLEKWLKDGTLEVDDKPALYLHDHHFRYHDRSYRRRSITCRVKLEEWDKMVIRPHEGTISEAKGDRLNLLWALQANTSPILVLYDDTHKKIASILEDESHRKQLLKANMDGGERHSLWAITDSEAVSGICNNLAHQPLYIADGHHRYESALAHRRERHGCSLSDSEEEPYDFVMMTLVDFTDPGLVIFPAHRLIRGLNQKMLDSLTAGLKTFFTMEEVPLNMKNIQAQIDTQLSGDTDEIKMLLFGLTGERFLALKLHDFNTISTMMPYFHSELYQKLDVSIVDNVILGKLLGLTHDVADAYLDYSNDALEAVNGVLKQDYQLAVILNPVKPEIIKAVADNGDRMPKKSTYFYPKIPSGLVFYRFC